MGAEKAKKALKLLDEAAAEVGTDSSWLTRDEQDMFERMFAALRMELRAVYLRKGVTDD